MLKHFNRTNMELKLVNSDEYTTPCHYFNRTNMELKH